MTDEKNNPSSPEQENPAPAGPETPRTPAPPSEGGTGDAGKPAVPKPPAPASGTSDASSDPAAKPAVPKPPAKPPAPKKPKGPQKEPYTGPLVDALKEKFPDQLSDAYTFLGMRHLVIEKGRLTEIMGWLRSNDVEAFDFLSDETATHWPAEEEFELVYVLFSFVTNARVVIKTRTKEWETIESLVAIWPGADWLEREIYDMFGVRFVNHPDLKRILLPEDWNGFPLRKDYNVRLQDVEWVRKHLGIESGQRFYVGEARHDDA